MADLADSDSNLFSYGDSIRRFDRCGGLAVRRVFFREESIGCRGGIPTGLISSATIAQNIPTMLPRLEGICVMRIGSTHFECSPLVSLGRIISGRLTLFHRGRLLSISAAIQIKEYPCVIWPIGIGVGRVCYRNSISIGGGR